MPVFYPKREDDDSPILNQYRHEIDGNLSFDADARARLAASLHQSRGELPAESLNTQPAEEILIDASAGDAGDIANRPYFASSEDAPARQGWDRARVARWARQAAAVMLVIVLAAVLLPKRPGLSQDGESEASELSNVESSLMNTSASTSASDVTFVSTADPSATDISTVRTSRSTTATTRIPSNAKYTSGPLAILCTPGTFGGGNWFTEEQVRAIFGAITSLSDEMDILYEHVTVSQGFNEFYFADMSHSAGKVFVIAECFDTGVRELRLCNTTGGEYEVLDSKPLPDGYDRLTLYDRYMRYACPSMCITQADLDTILSKGFLAPLIEGKNAKFSSNGTYFSDDKMVLGFNFYMPSIQSHVFINENYRTRQMQYTLSQIPNLKLLEEGPYTGTVPLSDKADRYAYAAASYILNG